MTRMTVGIPTDRKVREANNELHGHLDTPFERRILIDLGTYAWSN